MKLRYSDFAHRIDIDALEEALGFEVIDHPTPDEDRGYCILPWNSHSNGDTTGKLSINRKKRVYHCWVCGGGNLLDLAMSVRGEDIEPTIKWLRQFTNNEETCEEFLDELELLLADPAEQKTTTPYFNSHVLDRFNDPLEEAMEWDDTKRVSFLEKRALKPDQIEWANIRYTKLAARPLKEVEYHGPAIIFPHFWQGRLVGWQQRWLDREEDRPRHVPKYTMTPDFPKNETIYAWDQAQQRHTLGITVVESVPSALFLWSHGYPAVATFGSSVSDKQLKLLRTFPRLILAPDNDDAGAKWVCALLDNLERFTEVTTLPPVMSSPGADIGDLAEAIDPQQALKDHYALELETWEI